MPRFPPRPALLAALLCLAACAPTSMASVAPSATAPTWPTATATPTATLALAPTPTRVPTGWTVLDTPRFSLAYPAGWSVQAPNTNTGGTIYFLAPPSPHDQGVRVTVYSGPPGVGSEGMAPYCVGPGQVGVGRVTLAGLPMAYQFGAGEGAFMRVWDFVNAAGTHFTLDAEDAQGAAAVQAQDDSILVTFRPDNAIPWGCKGASTSGRGPRRAGLWRHPAHGVETARDLADPVRQVPGDVGNGFGGGVTRPEPEEAPTTTLDGSWVRLVCWSKGSAPVSLCAPRR